MASFDQLGIDLASPPPLFPTGLQDLTSAGQSPFAHPLIEFGAADRTVLVALFGLDMPLHVGSVRLDGLALGQRRSGARSLRLGGDRFADRNGAARLRCRVRGARRHLGGTAGSASALWFGRRFSAFSSRSNFNDPCARRTLDLAACRLIGGAKTLLTRCTNNVDRHNPSGARDAPPSHFLLPGLDSPLPQAKDSIVQAGGQ
jgi:hypothetical protein